MLTIQDVIEHCERQCNRCENLSKSYENFKFANSKEYQEHYLVKQCLEELMMYRTILQHDVIYAVRSRCECGLDECPVYDCDECPLKDEFSIKEYNIDSSIINKIMYSENKHYELNKNCFFNKSDAENAVKNINNNGFDYNCSKCGHRFMESESYKWRINHRIIDCCPKCKQPIMYARGK